MIHVVCFGVLSKRKNGVLQGIDAAVLVLWKLKVPEPIKPSRDLAQCITLHGDLSRIALELEDLSDTVLDDTRLPNNRLLP